MQRIERLRGDVALSEAKKNPVPNKHTVFVDTEEEFERFDPEEYFNSPLEIVQALPFNRITKDQLRSGPLTLNSDLIDKSEPLLAPVSKDFITSMQSLSEAQLASKEAELQGRIKREKKLKSLIKESRKMREKLVCLPL